jgi:hypothetical protein
MVKYLIRPERRFQALFSSDLSLFVAMSGPVLPTQKNGGAEAPPP